MQSTINTEIDLAFYSKDENNIRTIRSIIEQDNIETLSELLTNISFRKKYKLNYEGSVSLEDRNIYRTNKIYFIRLKVDFKGLSNLNLNRLAISALSDRFGPYEVTMIYFDKSARVNSDAEGIIFNTRVKIEYHLHNRKNIMTEYYSSNDDLISGMRNKGINLDNYFDIAEKEDEKELEDILEDDNIYVTITYYQFDYFTELDNDNISSFLHKFSYKRK